MNRFCEGIIKVFSNFVFGNNSGIEEKEQCKKEEYLLSSVFPTTEVMTEVKKYI